jgi:hypothetical protein
MEKKIKPGAWRDARETVHTLAETDESPEPQPTTSAVALP